LADLLWFQAIGSGCYGGSGGPALFRMPLGELLNSRVAKKSRRYLSSYLIRTRSSSVHLIPEALGRTSSILSEEFSEWLSCRPRFVPAPRIEMIVRFTGGSVTCDLASLAK